MIFNMKLVRAACRRQAPTIPLTVGGGYFTILAYSIPQLKFGGFRYKDSGARIQRRIGAAHPTII
jgi:hypothetical protein